MHSPSPGKSPVRLGGMSNGMPESDISAPSDVVGAGVEGAADLPLMYRGWLICGSSRCRLLTVTKGY